MPLKIRNWDRHYETNDTRKLVSLHWVKIPNQQDSLSYRLIAAHPRGSEIFAAWVLILQVASKGRKEERGNLPLSPDELGIVTGFPAEIFSLAIDFLKTPKIGWIEQSPVNLPLSTETPGESPENLPLKERRNGTEQKERISIAKAEVKKHAFEESPLFDKRTFRSKFTDWDEAKCREWYTRAVEYSGANGGRYADWGLALQAWERKQAAQGSTDAKTTNLRPRHKTAAEIQAERGF